jgi:hypothetical protein
VPLPRLYPDLDWKAIFVRVSERRQKWRDRGGERKLKEREESEDRVLFSCSVGGKLPPETKRLGEGNVLLLG